MIRIHSVVHFFKRKTKKGCFANLNGRNVDENKRFWRKIIPFCKTRETFLTKSITLTLIQ